MLIISSSALKLKTREGPQRKRRLTFLWCITILLQKHYKATASWLIYDVCVPVWQANKEKADGLGLQGLEISVSALRRRVGANEQCGGTSGQQLIGPCQCPGVAV